MLARETSRIYNENERKSEPVLMKHNVLKHSVLKNACKK